MIRIALSMLFSESNAKISFRAKSSYNQDESPILRKEFLIRAIFVCYKQIKENYQFQLVHFQTTLAALAKMCVAKSKSIV